MRLIDLHVDWLLQYAGETTVFDPACYPGISDRLGQIQGYLQDTSAAVLACYRRADDWAPHRENPWAALDELITRVEAEFPGRLLHGSEDLARWQAEPEGLCWGILGVEGFDALVRAPADLERLPQLFKRGVRVYQPVYAADNTLAGAAADGDDRGLTDLGRAFLQTLHDLSQPRARPLFDLAHLNPRAAGEALAWFEADAERPRRVVPIYSHGAPVHDGFGGPRALTSENLRRLRALGGVAAWTPSFFRTADQFKAAIEEAAALPFEGRAGYEGIALATDFLGVDETLPGLGTVEEIVNWVAASFEPAAAAALAYRNALHLLTRAMGRPPSEP